MSRIVRCTVCACAVAVLPDGTVENHNDVSGANRLAVVPPVCAGAGKPPGATARRLAKGAAPMAPRSITVSVDDARLIRSVFLPRNPNKMRGADPAVVAAAKSFIRAVDAASGGDVGT